MTNKTPQTRIKQLGKKGLKDKKELSAIAPVLEAKSKGKCMKCGKLPDFRGLQKHHLAHRAQGGNNSLLNVEMWCGLCHDTEHNTAKKTGPRDRTHDWEKQGMSAA